MFEHLHGVRAVLVLQHIMEEEEAAVARLVRMGLLYRVLPCWQV